MPYVLEEAALASAAGLALVWVGYPAAVALAGAAKRDQRGGPDQASWPTVSVIIATRDDDAAVRGRIANCLMSTYDLKLLDIVVAVDAAGRGLSFLDTSEMPGNVRFVAGDAPGGKAATLNAAVRAARGKVLVFTDTHQRFELDAISLLVAALNRDGRGAASGRLDLPREEERGGKQRSLVGSYWSYERWLRRSEAKVHSCVGVTGAIFAMWRVLWTPLPQGLLLDDVYTPMLLVLAGHRVDFVDAARAIETRPADPTQEYRRKVRTLTGIFQLCAWMPRVLLPIRNPIWVQFVCHKLLRLLTPYWLLVIALWLAVLALRWATEDAPRAALVALVVAAGVVLTRADALRRIREVIASGLMLQAAVIVATVNGFRGRWDVWHR